MGGINFPVHCNPPCEALLREEPLTLCASSKPPTRQLNHSGRPLPLRSWNAHAKRTFGSLCKERGSRSYVCDRQTWFCMSVTNVTSRPSFFMSIMLVRIATTVLPRLKSPEKKLPALEKRGSTEIGGSVR